MYDINELEIHTNYLPTNNETISYSLNIELKSTFVVQQYCCSVVQLICYCNCPLGFYNKDIMFQ